MVGETICIKSNIIELRHALHLAPVIATLGALPVPTAQNQRIMTQITLHSPRLPLLRLSLIALALQFLSVLPNSVSLASSRLSSSEIPLFRRIRISSSFPTPKILTHYNPSSQYSPPNKERPRSHLTIPLSSIQSQHLLLPRLS